MCIGCHWAQYRDFLPPDGAPTAAGLTRRQALRRGALLTATAVAAAASPGFVAEAVAAADAGADLVFHNGPVYTVDASRPWIRAVAVKGTRIVFAGDDDGAATFVGPGTRVVDLAGRMLLPGFVEGHTHPVVGSVTARGVDLQVDGREESLAVLRDYRTRIGKADVVRGYGWRYSSFPANGPRKEELDAIWPDTPVFLFAGDAHGAWVNSKMLAMANVTKDTPDPMPGVSYFQRDPATGEPTGFLAEPAAMLGVLNAVAPFTPDYVAESLEEWLPKASAAGITSLLDAGMALLPEEAGYEIYMDLERRGRLPFRVVGTSMQNNPAVDPIPIINRLRQRFRSELVQASVLKLLIDGGESGHTAALLAPYADEPGNSGEPVWPLEQFKDVIRRADRDGIDVHIHTIGDRGARICFDAIEAAIKTNPPRDRRHALAHCQLVAEEDLPRFARLGVTAQFSAQWAVPDVAWTSITCARLGMYRANSIYRVNSVLRHGGNVALGADWPAANYYSTFRPLDAIEVAMTRRELGQPGQVPVGPADEVIPLEAALRAATMGPAGHLGLDRQVGPIEVGKLADLIVLERNLFEVPPHEIHKTKVLMTVMNGQVRHG